MITALVNMRKANTKAVSTTQTVAVPTIHGISE
jgi:hypothetical protein